MSSQYWHQYNTHNPLLSLFPPPQALAVTTGRDASKLKDEYDREGDLGKVAASSRAAQRLMFQPKPLTVREVGGGGGCCAWVGETPMQGSGGVGFCGGCGWVFVGVGG